MSKMFCVYILSNKRQGTLYIGITSELPKRIYQHKNKSFEGFSKKYGLDKLVYYELYKDAITAITREKRLKKWKRQWKINSRLKHSRMTLKKKILLGVIYLIKLDCKWIPAKSMRG